MLEIVSFSDQELFNHYFVLQNIPIYHTLQLKYKLIFFQAEFNCSVCIDTKYKAVFFYFKLNCFCCQHG